MPQIDNTTSYPLITGANVDSDDVWLVVADGSLRQILTSELLNVIQTGITTDGDTLYVSSLGNDSTAVVGNPNRPYLTLQAARTAAGSGDLINVLTGSYTTSASLAKDGVNWHFEPGTTVTYNGSSDTEGIFDDGATAMSYSVTGWGTFVRNAVDASTALHTIVRVGHASSSVIFTCKKLDGQGSNDSPPTLVSITAGKLSFRADEIVLATNSVGTMVTWSGGTFYAEINALRGTTTATTAFVGLQLVTNNGGICVCRIGSVTCDLPLALSGSTSTTTVVDCAVGKMESDSQDINRNYAATFGTGSSRVNIRAGTIIGALRKTGTGTGTIHIETDSIIAMRSISSFGSLVHWAGSGGNLYCNVKRWDGSTISGDLFRLTAGTITLAGGVVIGSGSTLVTRVNGATTHLSNMRIEAGDVVQSSGTLTLSNTAITAGALSGTVTKQGFVYVSGTDSSTATWRGVPTVPIGNVSGLGTNVATFLATPSSANLASAVTDETGTGTLLFSTSPVIGTDITIPNTGLHLLDTNASHDLIIAPGSDLTADRTLTFTTGDSSRTLTISGDATVSQDYSTAGTPSFTGLTLTTASSSAVPLRVNIPANYDGYPFRVSITGSNDILRTFITTDSTDITNRASAVYFLDGNTGLSKGGIGWFGYLDSAVSGAISTLSPFYVDNHVAMTRQLSLGSAAFTTPNSNPSIRMGVTTTPSTFIADTATIWAEDYTAGDTRFKLLTETGGGLWLGNQTLEAVAPASGAGNSLSLKASAAVSGNNAGGSVIIQTGAPSGSGGVSKLIMRPSGGTAGSQEWQQWYQTSDGHGYIVCRNTGGDNFSGMLRWHGSSNNWTFGNIGQGAGVVYVLRCFADTYWGAREAGFCVAAGLQYGFSATNNIINGAFVVGLKRSADGVLLVTDGTTGYGKLLCGTLVEANTAVAASPNVLTAVETRTLLTNEGTTARNYHTLPTAVAGLDFEFVVQDTDGIRVVADTGDTIRDVGTVSTTAGFIQSSTVGSVIRLKAINATEWFVVYKQGTWTIDS